MKKAFTLIELMAVVAIIGVLLGIITTAAANSIQASRKQQAKALVTIVQQGIETYHAQRDEWPKFNGSSITSGNVSGDPNKYVIPTTTVDDMIREVVRESAENRNPMMDIAGLFVSDRAGNANDKHYGMNFWDAVRATKKGSKRMGIGQMHFGYPESSHGWFRSFKIVYSIPTDSLEVSTQ